MAPREVTGRPRPIAIIVASHNARGKIEACLGALLDQIPPCDAEILVVDSSSDGTPDLVHERFPEVRLLRAPDATLVPQLWALGIRASGGEIVALTTAHCVPDRRWVERLLAAHKAPVAAVGGVIEQDARAGIVDWAVYFCRYSAYMPPARPGRVADLAADNASYKRTHLDRCRRAWEKGFWEPVVHRALAQDGAALVLAPALTVRHTNPFSLAGFVRQRFRHGRVFGTARAATLARARRVGYAALIPGVPLLLLVRIARRVVRHRRYLPRFALALPALVLFVFAWGVGEFVGVFWASRERA